MHRVLVVKCCPLLHVMSFSPFWLKPFPSKTMWRVGVLPAVVVDPMGKTTAGARGNSSAK